MLDEIKTKSILSSLKDNAMFYPEICRHKDPVLASFIPLYKFSTHNNWNLTGITEERNQQRASQKQVKLY